MVIILKEFKVLLVKTKKLKGVTLESPLSINVFH